MNRYRLYAGRLGKLLAEGTDWIRKHPHQIDNTILPWLLTKGIDLADSDNLVCPLCGRRFNHRHALRSHVHQAHKKDIDVLARELIEWHESLK